MRVPTNLITGFLGSGKTSAIAKLLDRRPPGERWSILVNEFGSVSIDHAVVDGSKEGVAVQELGGGCACCTLATVFQPLLAQFIGQTRPDRLLLEPSGVSHPANVVDMLRGPKFSGSIELRNIICLIDPQDCEDIRWRETAVFQDQIQLADIVVLNWSDRRDRDSIDRCRDWVERFRPPKPLIVETSFGVIDPDFLDRQFDVVRFPLFSDAHPSSHGQEPTSEVLDPVSPQTDAASNPFGQTNGQERKDRSPRPGEPVRFQNDDPVYDACGWIFHVDDVFDRDELLDLLGYVHPIVRLKGVFRCQDDWWLINRAKDETSFAPTAYRRDSRLEVILDNKTSGWNEFQEKLVGCMR